MTTTMELCINCHIFLRSNMQLREYLAVDLDPNLVTIIEAWCGREVTDEDRLCHECFNLVTKEVENIEKTNKHPSSTSKQLGHTFVCISCGKSVGRQSKRRRHKLVEGSGELKYIASQIFPRQVSNESFVCQACWMNAYVKYPRTVQSENITQLTIKGDGVKLQKPDPLAIDPLTSETVMKTEENAQSSSISVEPNVSNKRTLTDTPKPITNSDEKTGGVPTYNSDNIMLSLQPDTWASPVNSSVEPNEDVTMQNYNTTTIIREPIMITDKMALPPSNCGSIPELEPDVLARPKDSPTGSYEVITLQNYDGTTDTPEPVINTDETTPPSPTADLLLSPECDTWFPPVNSPIEPQEVIFLPNYRRTADTPGHCFVPKCKSSERRRVPIYLKKKILKDFNLFITSNARVCQEHITVNNWQLLDEEDFISSFNSTQLESMINLLKCAC